MKHPDHDQFKVLFDRLRQRDQAHVPSFDRVWRGVTTAQHQRSSASRNAALAFAAGVLLLLSLTIFSRLNNRELTETPIDFDDTRLMVSRHFQQLQWYSPTQPLLNISAGMPFTNDDTQLN